MAAPRSLAAWARRAHRRGGGPLQVARIDLLRAVDQTAAPYARVERNKTKPARSPPIACPHGALNRPSAVRCLARASGTGRASARQRATPAPELFPLLPAM